MVHRHDPPPPKYKQRKGGQLKDRPLNVHHGSSSSSSSSSIPCSERIQQSASAALGSECSVQARRFGCSSDVRTCHKIVRGTGSSEGVVDDVVDRVKLFERANTFRPGARWLLRPVVESKLLRQL